MVDNAVGYGLETEHMRWFFDHYARTPADCEDWRLSPLRGDLHGLPPAFVVTAEYDPLRDQGEAYAEKLEAAGVETAQLRVDGVFHGFFGMHGFLEPAQPAWDRAVGAAAHDPSPERRRELTCRWIRKPRASATRSTRSAVRPRATSTCKQARDGLAMLHASGAGPAEDVYAIGDLDADGVPVRVYRPSSDDGLPVVVYFHGGGWTIGSVDVYDPITRALANAANAIVVSVEYRLAPEHPYPRAARRLLDRARVGHQEHVASSKATHTASPSRATARAATSPPCAR